MLVTACSVIVSGHIRREVPVKHSGCSNEAMNIPYSVLHSASDPSGGSCMQAENMKYLPELSSVLCC